eukprot:SAG31_NODE_1286_length_9000_cov_2.244692_4_plen_529_part_00
MAALDAVPNTWMSAVRGDMNPPNPADSNGLWQCEGGLELGLFAMKGFSLPTPAWMKRDGTSQFTTPDPGIGWPANIAEAQNRPIYGIWNLWKQAMPGRMYGSTALVFRNSVVMNGTFTVPMDSGAWIQMCNTTRLMAEYPCHVDQSDWHGDPMAACLCDDSINHNLSRCESAQRNHDVQALRARNPLCVWRNGSAETLWECPGGLESNGCYNGTLVNGSLTNSSDSAARNGSCALLPDLTPETKDRHGQSIWIDCVWSGPGDQCGNCSAIPAAPNEAQGTLTAYHHILVQSAGYWADTRPQTDPNRGSVFVNESAFPSLPSRLAAIVSRSNHAAKENRTKLSHGVDRDFLEADVVANITYSNGVKFMLADIVALFGTIDGELLQRWAQSNGWALVWSLGWAESDWGMGGFPGGWGTDREDRRLLDLSAVLSNGTTGARGSIATNISAINATSGRKFKAKWEAVASVRRELTPHRRSSNTPLNWKEIWRTMLEDLPPDAFLIPISATSCADVDDCIGVTSDGDCACYKR